MDKELHIGIDDTDSLKGSCTTHLATIITTEIFDQIIFLDLPNLIRLNPNIPFKTRGNGAIALRVRGESSDLQNCKEIVIKLTEKFSQFDDKNTNPGIVFLEGSIPSEVKEFSKRAMWDVLTIKETEKFDEKSNIQFIKYGNGRGIIGGLSAIGNPLNNDFTYEHLTYRMPHKYGTKRLINRDSIIAADRATPLTFSNFDYEYKSVMITPRGADPVFTGIRGETINEVIKAWNLIEPLEEIAMLMIFRTNQHTNHHFIKQFLIQELRPYISVIVNGIISKKPFYIEGSHLIFTIKDDTGVIDCAAYEPTKGFRGQLSKLTIGDNVTIYGGIRPPNENHPLTINIERLQVNSLVDIYYFENPICDKCGARLKSAGKNKGYKCFKCSTIYREKKPIEKIKQREIAMKVHLPPIIAHRHLTKPFSRNGRDNTNQQLKEIVINDYLKEMIDINRKMICKYY